MQIPTRMKQLLAAGALAGSLLATTTTAGAAGLAGNCSLGGGVYSQGVRGQLSYYAASTCPQAYNGRIDFGMRNVRKLWVGWGVSGVPGTDKSWQLTGTRTFATGTYACTPGATYNVGVQATLVVTNDNSTKTVSPVDNYVNIRCP